MRAITGQRVLVTGGARGIGLSVARAFGRAGCELVLVDIDEEALGAAADELRAQGMAVQARVLDVSDPDAVGAMAAEVVDAIGGIDVLVNNAGLGWSGGLAETPPHAWSQLMGVNFWAPVYLVRALLPQMVARGSGHIVNVSSGQAFFRLPSWGAYAAAKVALGSWSEVLGVELREHGVRVTTVYPWMVDTGFYDTIEGQTWAARMVMRALPWYSMTPDRVGRLILEAVVRGREVEMVSPINRVGRALQALPGASRLLGRVAHRVLSGRSEARRRVGFRIDEIMTGEHELEPGCGPVGRLPMEFRVTWGPDDLRDWARPSSEGFLVQPMRGTVTVGGLCSDAPCEGELELRYFDDRSICYRFTFAAEGVDYRFTGTKTDIRLWNLPVSHTTCFGTLVEAATGRLVSRSVTHFRLRSAPAFLGSFRLVAVPAA